MAPPGTDGALIAKHCPSYGAVIWRCDGRHKPAWARVATGLCHEQATNQKHQTVMIVTWRCQRLGICLAQDKSIPQKAICFQWREPWLMHCLISPSSRCWVCALSGSVRGRISELTLSKGARIFRREKFVRVPQKKLGGEFHCPGEKLRKVSSASKRSASIVRPRPNPRQSIPAGKCVTS